MSGYIDLHNHILHNIDDGPATLGEAVKLARGLVEAGYAAVVVTPHVVEGSPPFKTILSRTEELKAEFRRENIKLNLHPGAELHIEPQILTRLKSGLIPTLAGSRYLLLELPFYQPLPIYAEELIFSLKGAGYRPIIAHPERAAALQDEPNLLYRLFELGALYQITWGALTGRLGPGPEKMAHLMVEAGLAHFFATDAHRPATRLAEVSRAAKYLESLLGPAAAEAFLISRPRAVIENKTFELPAPKPLKVKKNPLKPASPPTAPLKLSSTTKVAAKALKRLFSRTHHRRQTK